MPKKEVGKRDWVTRAIMSNCQVSGLFTYMSDHTRENSRKEMEDFIHSQG